MPPNSVLTRDPDGYLIEVGQTTTTAGPLDLYDESWPVP